MKNLRLQALTEHVQIIEGPVNVGVIRFSEKQVAMVDAGIEGAYGRRLLDLLRDNQYTVHTLLVTHAHADHIGGAAYIQRETGCRILAAPREVPAILFPEIQAIALFGAAPMPEFTNRFIMAESSEASNLPENGRLELAGLDVKILPLPGHSIDQVGFLVDGVAFTADTVFPSGFFQRHGPIYTYDPLKHLETLKWLRTVKADWYVGGHHPPLRDPEPLILENLRQTRGTLDLLQGMLAAPKPSDRLLKDFLRHFGRQKTGWEHFLQQATVRALLSALKREGRIDFRVMDNLVLWYATGQEPSVTAK